MNPAEGISQEILKKEQTEQNLLRQWNTLERLLQVISIAAPGAAVGATIGTVLAAITGTLASSFVPVIGAGAAGLVAFLVKPKVRVSVPEIIHVGPIGPEGIFFDDSVIKANLRDNIRKILAELNQNSTDVDVGNLESQITEMKKLIEILDVVQDVKRAEGLGRERVSLEDLNQQYRQLSEQMRQLQETTREMQEKRRQRKDS